MRLLCVPFLLLGLLALGACSSPASRIADNPQVFASFPPPAQAKIRLGQVDVGFTREMVVMALGQPTRRYGRRSDHGEAEVWVYNHTGPQVSLGVGLGTDVVGRGGLGGAVAVSTGTYDEEEKMRVEFVGGKVSLVESVQR